MNPLLIFGIREHEFLSINIIYNYKIMYNEMMFSSACSRGNMRNCFLWIDREIGENGSEGNQKQERCA